MDPEAIVQAFILTLLAGLATTISSGIAFFTQRTNTRFLVMALGFSAGIMIYVAFMELFPSGQAALVDYLGKSGELIAVISLFAGMVLVTAIDRLVPLGYNPHEMRLVENHGNPLIRVASPHLVKAGLLTALTITLHNFPEGLATFMAGMENLSLGVPVAVAVGIHNIPEGIAVSVPIYYATGDKRLAFGLSALSGLSEPLGAALGLLVFASAWSHLMLGLALAAVAGMMIFIALDVLLPSAECYGQHHPTLYALLAGMGVMALSLMVL
mgnify:CR=1 FL=1